MSQLEYYVTCPFNKSHRILKARFQTHLVKCRKSYPRDMKLVCPFDATHMLDPEEYQHHLTVCTTSGNIKCYQSPLEPIQTVGTVPIEEVCNLQSSTLDEDWSGNNPTYDPLAASQNKSIIRTAIGLSKSKKKQFKKQERERISALENNSCNNSSSNISISQKMTDFEQPLRAPKKAAKAMTYSQNDSINDLASKLMDISIETNNNLSTKKNISIMSHYSCTKTSSPDSSLRNDTSKLLNNSLSSKDSFEEGQKENLSKEGSNAGAKCQDTSKDSKRTVKEKGISEINGLQSQVNYEETAVQQNSSKQNNSESRKTITLNPRMAAKFYGEAKKISTGRGFTIAYQYLNNSSKAEEAKGNSKDLGSAYGYNED